MLPARDRRPPLPTPPPPTGLATTAEPHFLDDGRLMFRAPAGAYASLPAWHSRGAWLGAVRLHPGLPDACQHRAITVDLCLQVLHELTRYGDHDTGRDIAVSHDTVAAAIGRSSKTVQRACRAAENLGVLRHVLTGTDMSLPQRIAVLGHYSRGTPSHRWRSLPNFYAAPMPPSLTARPTPPGPHPNPPAAPPTPDCGQPPAIPPGCPPTRREHPPATSNRSSQLKNNPFRTALCTTTHPQARPSTHPPGRYAADNTTIDQAGPTPTASRPARRTVRQDLPDQLPGYRTLSLHRIGNALARYVHADLTPAHLHHRRQRLPHRQPHHLDHPLAPRRPSQPSPLPHRHHPHRRTTRPPPPHQHPATSQPAEHHRREASLQPMTLNDRHVRPHETPQAPPATGGGSERTRVPRWVSPSFGRPKGYHPSPAAPGRARCARRLRRALRRRPGAVGLHPARTTVRPTLDQHPSSAPRRHGSRSGGHRPSGLRPDTPALTPVRQERSAAF